MECVNLVLQSIFIEPVTEYLQVIWMQYAGVFLQLLVVGINLELSGFVTDDRSGRFRYGSSIIRTGIGTGVVQDTSLFGIDKGKRTAYVRCIAFASSSYPAGCQIIFTVYGTSPTQEVVGTERIEMAVVMFSESVQPIAHQVNVATQLVAQSQHGE